MTAKTNPLLAKPLPLQSTEVVREPVLMPALDTTTPAVSATAPRRFSLGDLPRYSDQMFGVLQHVFPHLHDRMYAGWLRGCIQDNASYFICLDGAVMLSQVAHDPLDPRPYVQIVFTLGSEPEKILLLKDTLRWASSLGAREARGHALAFAKEADVAMRTRTQTIFPLE